jgi:hypothetical protein
MKIIVRHRKFADIDLSDPFFNSLKEDYREFSDWFVRKSEDKAYVIEQKATGKLDGFLYLKIEDGPTTDIDPPLKSKRVLKVGTFKVNPHGTKLGERLLRTAFDRARVAKANSIYVTVFDRHEPLIKLFDKFGFRKFGEKTTVNGIETVLVRRLPGWRADPLKAFPYMKVNDKKKFLLAIYPEFHAKLFPDSPLADGVVKVKEDTSYGNTILKAYIAGFNLVQMKPGDIVVIYRTTDKKGQARTRSAATSICVVQDTFKKQRYHDEDDFVLEIKEHSVFSDAQLKERYRKSRRLQVVFMTYNAVLPKQVRRAILLDTVGISHAPRWDLRELTDTQFKRIIELGGLDESLIVD